MFNGWWDYLDSPASAYLPAAYETGYSCTACAGWTNYFGSKLLYNTNEWTYDYETSSISTFPTGWTLGSLTPYWFAEPSPPSTKCYYAWAVDRRGYA